MEYRKRKDNRSFFSKNSIAINIPFFSSGLSLPVALWAYVDSSKVYTHTMRSLTDTPLFTLKCF